MATIVELDPIFRQALKFLHSPNSDAAENIRRALDDVIKQKHGPNKMLINTLNKKYIAEESKATGSGFLKVAVRRPSNRSSDSSSSSPVQIIATTSTTSTTTVITTDLSGQTQEIPVIISLPDSSNSATIAAIDDNAMDTNIHNSLFDDLACVICRRIDLSAKNRLIECSKCTSLYHQECHSPQIKDSDLINGQELSWCCSNCKVKRFKSSHSTGSPSKSNNSSSPTSSSSSNSDVIILGSSSGNFGNPSSSSSSKRDKEHSSSTSSKSKSSSSRHHSHHHSSSHHSSKHERSSEKEKSSSSSSGGGSGSGSGSSSKNTVTPNIHIISADKRLQNMKKKAAKSQESKRKK